MSRLGLLLSFQYDTDAEREKTDWANSLECPLDFNGDRLAVLDMNVPTWWRGCVENYSFSCHNGYTAISILWQGNVPWMRQWSPLIAGCHINVTWWASQQFMGIGCRRAQNFSITCTTDTGLNMCNICWGIVSMACLPTLRDRGCMN